MIAQPYALFAIVAETWRDGGGRLEYDISVGRIVGWKEATDGVAYPYTVLDGRAGAVSGAQWRAPVKAAKGAKVRTVEFYVFSDLGVAGNALQGIQERVLRGVTAVREREAAS